MHVPLIVNWKGKAPSGRVNGDLIDSSDFMPTLLDAAGVKAPAGLQIDGRSFLAQVRGEKGRPREWFYCWYARDGGAKADREFAASHQYKLYRGGELYDYMADPKEERPLPAAEAAPARQMLQAALDTYRDVRPKGLAKLAGKGKIVD